MQARHPSQRHRGLAYAALVVLLLAACGSEPAPQAAAAEPGHLDGLGASAQAVSVDHEAILTFQQDWNNVLSQPPVYAGGRLTVSYHPARLPNCRATYNGMPTWSILMYHRFSADGPLTYVPLSPQGALLRATVEVPEDAEHVELWFLNNDRAGCSEYDSNLGDNFVFPVTLPAQPTTVRFGGDWRHEAEGTIEQGGLLRLDYAPERLGTCRARYAGGRAYNIIASWVFHPGEQTDSVALYDGDYFAGDESILQPTVQVPEDATSVELWFSNSDRAGCVAWDSAFGDNYHFDVAPAGGDGLRVGWAGEPDFVLFHRDPGDHRGDQDPAYYWDNMAGMPQAAWVEVQVWVPGLTDQAYASADDARGAATEHLLAQALTDAVPGVAGDDLGAVEMDFLRQQGNNFVYAFRFWKLRYVIYQDPPAPAGLYHYYLRFSADGGATWTPVGLQDDGRMRRFVVAPLQDCTLFPDHAPAGCPVERVVGWAGGWGQRASHACQQVEGAPDPVVFTKSAVGHDCMGITAEVWVEGLTDAGGAPDAILAEVETNLGFGGGPLAELATHTLTFDGRTGNNYRYVWWLGEHVARSERDDYHYRFRFSADGGVTWYTLGAGDGPDGGEPRRLQVRNDSHDLDVPECQPAMRWDGATNVFPECLPYALSEEFPASHCELYVNALGRGEVSHNGAWAHWLEAYVRVGAPEGELLEVGMWIRYVRADEVVEELSVGREIEPSYWLTGFTTGRGIPGGPQLAEADVHAFAFFVDVRRPGGEVVRLWQSAGGANYTLDACYAVPGYIHGIGVGSIEYADDSVALFDGRRACQ